MPERDEPTGALVRPYAVTRGTDPAQVGDCARSARRDHRPRPFHRNGRAAGGGEHQYIAAMCDGGRVQSLAEIAARMQLPLGVARVIVADMATDGLVAVYEPTSLEDETDAVGTELLERVLSGLRRL